MHRRHALFSLFGLTSLPLATSGCGGGSSPQNTPSTEPPVDEETRAADEAMQNLAKKQARKPGR